MKMRRDAKTIGIILHPSNKNGVPEEGRFQKKLQKSVTSVFFFWAGQYTITLTENKLNAVSHLERLKEIFIDLDLQNRKFLLSDNHKGGV